ncbi:MAG TPA: UPF0182 family protein [Acidimicrobiales bacterium]|nr:UPF0182 family protein [Acidimicrobiales bacterium]
MTIPADLPRRGRPRGGPGNRRRTLFFAAGGAVLFLLLFSSGIAGFYTDYLWFDDLGVAQVFTGVLKARLLLTGLFLAAAFLLVWGNLKIAERLSPRGPRRGPEDEVVQRYRDAVGSHAGKVRLAAAATLALLLAGGVGARWEQFLLFRNSVPFGTRDPQFQRDISFYVFDLPFRTFVVNWLLFALILTTVVTSAFHYLNGGIRLQVAQQRGATPQVKAHISVLLAGVAFVKAYSYWLARFELVYSDRGFAQGAFYTDVKARLPALGLLTLISVAAGLLLLANIWRRGFALPAVSTGLWLFVTVLVGSAYPAVIQQFKVKPAENRLETPYIQRNIDATRAAFGLTDVEVRNFDYTDAPGAVTGETLQDDAATIRNIRLWDPNERLARVTWQQQQSFRPYYQVLDVDVDRYPLNGQPTQVVVATRELKPSDLPQDNWVNRHLAYTHGYGAIIAPANAATPDGFPAYSLKDLPPTGVPELKQPRIYVGEQGDQAGVNDYAIVRTNQPEIDFQRPDGSDETSRYDGSTGVELDSTARKLAFAVRYREVNVLTSPFITDESKVLYVRGVKERIGKVAPFLTLDNDPYPVVTAEGRIVWIVDAYTTSSRYPYSQSVGARGSLAGVNYARNSVKAAVDAYDGTVTLYAVDGNDPVLKAYSKIFPGLFTDPAALTGAEADRYSNLREHFRYPEDLFGLQASLLGRYHITNPDEFFSATDRWNVSPDPGVQATTSAQTGPPVAATPGRAPGPGALGLTRLSSGENGRIPATYQLQRFPGDTEESFTLTVPFVPFDRDDKRLQLTAFLTARSDPGEYGKLILFRTPTGQQINGPSLVASNIQADSAISQQISLLNQEGSSVLFGNILLVPVDRSIIYVRPLYLQGDQNPVPKLVRVIVVYGNKSVMRNTLAEALAELFPGAPSTLEQNPGSTTTPTSQPPEGTPPQPGTTAPSASVADLISQADSAFVAAQAALKRGELAEYQRKVNEAADFVRRAGQRSGAAPPGEATTTPAPTSTAPAATTASG